MNKLSFVEFWKIIPVFAQEKEFVIKLLKFSNWVNSSVQATASLGIARKATEEIKKKKKKKIYIYIYIYIYISVCVCVCARARVEEKFFLRFYSV